MRCRLCLKMERGEGMGGGGGNMAVLLVSLVLSSGAVLGVVGKGGGRGKGELSTCWLLKGVVGVSV